MPEGSAAEAFFQENLPDIGLSNIMYESTRVLEIVWPDEKRAVGTPAQLGCLLDGEMLDPSEVNRSVDQSVLARITDNGVLIYLHAGHVAITAELRADSACECKVGKNCYAASPMLLPDVLQRTAKIAQPLYHQKLRDNLSYPVYADILDDAPFRMPE